MRFEFAIIILMSNQVTLSSSSSPGSSNVTLADILLSQKAISEAISKEIKLAEVQTGKSQEKIIAERGDISEEVLTKAKAVLFNVPYVDLTAIPTSPEALAVLPQEVAQRFKVFPLSIDPIKKVLNLAMYNPLDIAAQEFVQQRTGYFVKPFAAELSKLEPFIATGYATSLAKEVTEALREASNDRGVRVLDASKRSVIREEKVAEIVTQILSFAVKARASDVHIEPLEKLTRVRYRIDGILQEKLTIPKTLHDAVVSRVKILSGMKIDERRIPQDGRFTFKVENREVDLRVSSLPATDGEKVVMRILEKSIGIPDLPELGLRGRALKNLQDAIRVPHGIVLICGPTGSGKTTTLYSVIQRLNTPQVNIVTLEDPVEYKIPGVNQVQINVPAGLTFASGLRSFLRQDPNIILVGEIRDKETSELAIQAALTGHLVFATLHTNGASGALPRLLDMGAEPYLLASSINAIVGQRVVRKIHEECKTPVEEAPPKLFEEMKEVLGNLWDKTKDSPTIYKGKGDKNCGESGYWGRIGIFEVLPVTEQIGRIILEHGTASQIESIAKREGMVTMKQDGYLKVLEGLTTVEEVIRVAEE